MTRDFQLCEFEGHPIRHPTPSASGDRPPGDEDVGCLPKPWRREATVGYRSAQSSDGVVCGTCIFSNCEMVTSTLARPMIFVDVSARTTSAA
jgi:hypothetical protein